MKNEEIKLNLVWQKRYSDARIIVYSIFVLLLIYAAYLILFPSALFSFSFKTPDSSKNTVVDPRNEKGELIRNGQV